MTYSKDGDHFYPEAVENISKIISGQKDIKGFGIIITRDNVDKVLIDLEQQIKNYDLNRTI